MSQEIYQELCKALSRRRGMYPGMDIPEFYELAAELFTPEEASVYNAIPRGFHPAETIAEHLDLPAAEVTRILETMADKGLCIVGGTGTPPLYGAPPFVPGIFEYQFMRGTFTERDKRLARLIHNYKAAVDAARGPVPITFPPNRVIPINRAVRAGQKVHTFDQVKSYIESYEPLAVCTCFCRHEGRLLDENDHCGKPDEVCMQFGQGARFVIERNMGRPVGKAEALEILRRAEEAGLVHATVNRQEIDFLCNCCSCHCMILKSALAQPKPGTAVGSGFVPERDPQRCTACGTCIERCPAHALSPDQGGGPQIELDRCIGCGVCASGCPSEALGLVEKAEAPVPPLDQKALGEALKAGRS